MDFRELTSFFVVPLGILVGSGLIQRQFRMRLNAGIEFFTFLMGIDLTFLIWADVGSLRINPNFQGIYGPLFVLLFLGSFVSMGFAARVQSLVYDHVSGQLDYYPLMRISLCWLLALSGIALHLYVALGGSN